MAGKIEDSEGVCIKVFKNIVNFIFHVFFVSLHVFWGGMILS